MRNIRPKYKVRWQRGRNALRCMWKRTEQNRRKWKVKKTGRRVRKSRNVKRMTARNMRSNNRRVGGGITPRKGKLKIWRKKKRNGRKGIKRRYGGSYRSEVSTKRRSKILRKQTRRCLRVTQLGTDGSSQVRSPWRVGFSYIGSKKKRSIRKEERNRNRVRKNNRYKYKNRNRNVKGRRMKERKAASISFPFALPKPVKAKVKLCRGKKLSFLGPFAMGVRTLPRTMLPWEAKRLVSKNHVRGKREMRAEMRRWRAGRAHSRRTSRKRREEGAVRWIAPLYGPGINVDPLAHKNTTYELSPGEGRQIQEECWKTRKGDRIRRQFGRSRRSLARKRNGRTGYSYLQVDYKTGVRRVKRRPRSGEVRRPARMERRRWMF